MCLSGTHCHRRTYVLERIRPLATAPPSEISPLASSWFKKHNLVIKKNKKRKREPVAAGQKCARLLFWCWFGDEEPESQAAGGRSPHRLSSPQTRKPLQRHQVIRGTTGTGCPTGRVKARGTRGPAAPPPRASSELGASRGPQPLWGFRWTFLHLSSDLLIGCCRTKRDKVKGFRRRSRGIIKMQHCNMSA